VITPPTVKSLLFPIASFSSFPPGLSSSPSFIFRRTFYVFRDATPGTKETRRSPMPLSSRFFHGFFFSSFFTFFLVQSCYGSAHTWRALGNTPFLVFFLATLALSRKVAPVSFVIESAPPHFLELSDCSPSETLLFCVYLLISGRWIEPILPH